MKKIYLLTVFLITTLASGQIINIPDPAFKSALIAMGVDSNSDGEIQFLEASTVTALNLNHGTISDLFGINNFVNLTTLYCSNNQINTVVDVSNLINLVQLELNDNQITALNVSGLTNLTGLWCGNNQLTSLDLTGLTSLSSVYCPNNLITDLTLTPSLQIVSCGENNMTSLDVSNLVNLQHLNFNNCSNLQTFIANGLTNLTVLQSQNNPQLLSMDVSGCTLLNDVVTTGNTVMNTLNVQGCLGLDYLWCEDSQLTTLNASNLPTLIEIRCNNNLLTSLDVTNCIALESIYASQNQIATLDLSSSPLLELLFLDNNQLLTLDVSNHINLTTLVCNANPLLTSLDISGCVALPALYLSGLGALNSLLVSGCTALQALDCGQNVLTSLDVSGLNSLTNLNCRNNQITTLNLTGCTALTSLTCFNNELGSLDLTGLSVLELISCEENNLTSLNTNNLTNLTQLNCAANLLTTLDLSQNSMLTGLNCSVNQLETLFIKNGSYESSLNFQLNSNLVYVCADEFQVLEVQSLIQQFQLNTVCNDYCSLYPGGYYNTITGKVIFDLNDNGCDNDDVVQPFVRIDFNDGFSTQDDSSFTDNGGTYSYYVGSGDYSITPNLENLPFFTLSPQNSTASFPDDNNNVFIQDFCVTPNGIHPDLEIAIAPVIPARPGLPAIYLITYKNKGNQILSEQYGVNFFYNQNLMSFVSATVAPSSQAAGGIQWDYANLVPFESRSILVTMLINTPTDTNPVNLDDVLTFTAIILPQAGDEQVIDNTFVLDQVVVNAYDPNDITCLQGDVVSPNQIGEYLHYFIRFENTGNAAAENIVVKTEIDPAQFDINSLQMLSTSHEAFIRMTGNKIEFMFQNIQLESGGHGNILLKVRTNETLEVGDFVAKMANIYFDYNYPIETNEAETLFQALSIENPVLDSLISIYPNPVKEVVNITIKENASIKTIELYDIQGRLLQTQFVNDIASELNLSQRATGMYFIKITTDQGIKVEKLVKK